MITSILDNDLYKYTMMFAILSNKDLSNLKVRYQFFNRNDVKFPEGFDIELKKRVQDMSNLKLTPDEKKFFMTKCGHYLPNWFFSFIDGYKYDSNEVFIFMENGNLKIKIEGFWHHTILWEVPLMALISELYFEMTNKNYNFNSSSNRQIRLQNNQRKASLMVMNGLKVSDFGTRRRYSYDNHKEVLGDLLSYGRGSITGTSNVHLAHLFNINCHGTLAHELFMVHAAIYGYTMANKMTMDTWINTYNTNQLGTILPDTFTTDVFLKSFDNRLSNIFNTVRQDSGDPIEFTDKMINHYKSFGIDPMSKTIIFSDGLNVEKSVKLKDYCNGKIKCAFGIGTDLTNSINDVKPLNMVIKISEVYFDNMWIPAVKLSDNKMKNTGITEEVELCKKVLKII